MGPGSQAWFWLFTEPTCQSWGAMIPPAACTSSMTCFQTSSESCPQNLGTLGSLAEADRWITVPSDTISPTSAPARRA